MKLIFDPNNPLSDKELDEVAEKDFDAFLDYLDQQSEHLKKGTRKLNTTELKQQLMMKAKLEGREVTDEEWESVKSKGIDNEKETLKKQLKEEQREILKRNGVKNVKTNRDQWFD